MNNRLCRYNCGLSPHNCSAADCEIKTMLRDLDEREYREQLKRKAHSDERDKIDVD